MPAQPSGHILELLAPRSRSNLLFLSSASEPSLARWGTDEVLQNLSGTGQTHPIWSLGTVGTPNVITDPALRMRSEDPACCLLPQIS